MRPEPSPRTFPFQRGGAAEATRLPSGSVTLEDLTPLPRFGLKGPGSNAWLTAAGWPLPEINRVGTHRGIRMLCLGGEDILLTAENSTSALDGIREAWNVDTDPKGYSSWREEGWAWMRLSGTALDDALARLCALDLRAGRFPENEIAQTRFAGVEGVVLRTGDAFDVFFDITMSASVARSVAAVGKHCAGSAAHGAQR